MELRAKKIVARFNGSFLSKLVEEGKAFLFNLRGPFVKILGNHSKN